MKIHRNIIERHGGFIATAEIFEDDGTVARRPNAHPIMEATSYLVSAQALDAQLACKKRDSDIQIIVRQYEKDRGNI